MYKTLEGMGYVGTEPGALYQMQTSTTTTLTSPSPLTLPNSAGKYLKLSLAGVSKQDSTTGAQLIDMSAENWEHGGINGSTGIDEMNQNATRLRIKSGTMISVKPSTTYTISRYNLDYCVAIRFYDVNGIFAGDIHNGKKINGWILPPTTEELSFMVTTNAKAYYARMLIGKGDSTQNVSLSDLANIKIQLQEGSTAKPWEPYTGGKPSPSLDCPQKIKSSDDKIIIKIADGTGKEQTASICAREPVRSIGGNKDIISKKGGIWGVERKIIEYTFDGAENWTIGDFFGYKIAAISVSKSNMQYNTENLRCSHAKALAWSNTGVVCFVDNYTIFRFGGMGVEQVQTLETWKSWLADQASKGTPLTIIYTLATPVWEPLDDATQAALNALAAYKGTTVIDIDSGEVGVQINATYKVKKGR